MKLAWEIEVLSRAIQYPNLSVAATQIGLSQPQLSRILQRVEADLGLLLLERDSKRQVSWKPEAIKLANVYSQISRSWDLELKHLQGSKQLKKIRVGCLEGLSEVATEYIAKVVKLESSLEEIEIESLDLGELEKAFLAQEIDLMLSSRSPGKKKFQYLEVIGHQKFTSFQGTSEWQVKTPFEILKDSKLKSKKNIVTKSLWLKTLCRDKLHASAMIPQKLNKKLPKDSQDFVPVFMIARDDFPKELWKELLRS